MVGERDILRFAEAVGMAKAEAPISEGFTVYNEGLIHKTVKLYLDPDPRHHEVALDHAVADVLNEDGIFEVQTGSPLPLLPKIKALLPDYKVTLVLPYRARTRHLWLDPDSGEITAPRRIASRPKSLSALARSFSAVKELIGNENFAVRAIALEIDELRLADGYGKDKHRRATLVSRTPVAILDDITLSKSEDYLCLLPDTLGDEFTAPEYLGATGSRSKYDRMALSLFTYLGLVDIVGKRGNARIYRRTVG